MEHTLILVDGFGARLRLLTKAVVKSHIRRTKTGVSQVKEHQRTGAAHNWTKRPSARHHETLEHDHGQYAVTQHEAGYSASYKHGESGERYNITGAGKAHSRLDPRATEMKKVNFDTAQEARAAAEKHHEGGAKAELSPYAQRRKGRIARMQQQMSKAIKVRVSALRKACEKMYKGDASDEEEEEPMEKAAIAQMQNTELEGHRLEELNKAVNAAMEIDATGDAAKEEWDVGRYHVELVKLAKSIGVASITGPDMVVPLHVVVPDMTLRYKMANEVIQDLVAGKAPRRGIFRARQVPTEKWPGRHGR